MKRHKTIVKLDRFQNQLTYPFDEQHINDVLTTLADPDWFIGR